MQKVLREKSFTVFVFFENRKRFSYLEIFVLLSRRYVACMKHGAENAKIFTHVS